VDEHDLPLTALTSAFVLASRAEVDVTYDSLSVSEVIPARPERIYSAWLSSDEHTAFTGDKAVVEPFVGGKHSAFDGYAVGRTVDLQPGHRIVQTWRAEDFPVGSPDSRVEVTLEETVGGTMLTILHTEIPSGQGSQYRDGWLKYYLEPLKGYFVVEQPAKTNGVPKRAPKSVAKAARPKVPAARRPSAQRAAAKKRPANAKRPKKTKAARPKATKPKRGGKPRGSAKTRSGAKRRTRR
jgi:uncharacterized protein YndB with AHSA1/START domain